MNINFSGLSVLIVEGSTAVRNGLLNCFREMGFADVFAASSPASARQLIVTHRNIDLVVSELEFYNHNAPVVHRSGTICAGLEFIEDIKRNYLLPLKTAYVILSAESSYTKVYDTLMQGIDAYILKPAKPIILEHRISQVLFKKIALRKLYEAIDGGKEDVALDMASHLYTQQQNQQAGKIAVNMLIEKDAIDQAKALITDSAQLNHAWAAIALAKIELRLNNVHKSISQLKALLEENDKQANVWELLHYAYMEDCNFVEASNAIKKCVDIAPNNIVYLQQYGMLLFKQGLPEAFDYLIKACRLGKNSNLFNYSVLIAAVLSRQHAHSLNDLRTIDYYLNKDFKSTVSSFRVQTLTALVQVMRLIRPNWQETQKLEPRVMQEFKDILNTAMLNAKNPKMDWDTALSLCYILNEYGSLMEHHALDQCVHYLASRFIVSKSTYMSMCMAFKNKQNLTDIATKHYNEINEFVKLKMDMVQADPVGVITECQTVGTQQLNAKILHMGLALLLKYQDEIAPVKYRELLNEFENVKKSAIFNGLNSFASSRWFLTGRY